MQQFTDTVVSREEVDAVVVGARVGGAATAIALARRGRKVIALDRAKFPSDTISTHVLFATGVAIGTHLTAEQRAAITDPDADLAELDPRAAGVGRGPTGRTAALTRHRT